jgi:hypothetical protein
VDSTVSTPFYVSNSPLLDKNFKRVMCNANLGIMSQLDVVEHSILFVLGRSLIHDACILSRISFDEISSLRAKFQQLESEAEENKISLKEAATLAKDLKQEVKVMVKLRGKLSIMDKDLEEAKIK